AGAWVDVSELVVGGSNTTRSVGWVGRIATPSVPWAANADTSKVYDVPSPEGDAVALVSQLYFGASLMAPPLAGVKVDVSGQALSWAFGVLAELGVTDSFRDCGVSPSASANDTAPKATGVLASGPPWISSPPDGAPGA